MMCVCLTIDGNFIVYELNNYKKLHEREHQTVIF